MIKKIKNIVRPELALLAAVSVSAFVFLNAAHFDSLFKQNLGIHSGELRVEETTEDDEESRKLNSNHIPETAVAKKVYELMRKYIPAS